MAKQTVVEFQCAVEPTDFLAINTYKGGATFVEVYNVDADGEVVLADIQVRHEDIRRIRKALKKAEALLVLNDHEVH
jgi:hypothetical protein